MVRPASLLAALVALVTAPATAQIVIPVYPGATLEIDPDGPACCTFKTADPLAKVVAFYEARLKTPALTADALAQKRPDVAGRVRAMASQLPPGVQYRAFPLPDQQVFELLAMPGAVTFSISEEQLGTPGAAYAQEFATQVAQAAEGREVEVWNPTRQEYEQWLTDHPLATAADVEIPIYSGARVESKDERAPGCREAVLITPDPMDQVVAFYATKLGAGYVRNPLDETVLFEHTEFEVQGLGGEDRTAPVVVIGPSTAVNRRVQIGTGDEMWRNVPRFDPDLRMAVMERVAATIITFTREVPTQACVGREGARFIRRER